MRKDTGRYRVVIHSALLPGRMDHLGAGVLMAVAADLAEAGLVAVFVGEDGR